MFSRFIYDNLWPRLHVALLKENNLIPGILLLFLRLRFRHTTHRPFFLGVPVFLNYLLRRFGSRWLPFNLFFLLWPVILLGFFIFQEFVHLVDIILNHILVFFIHFL